LTLPRLTISRAIFPASCPASTSARHASGKLLIMEIELIEPELFFRFGENAELRLLTRVAADLA
jgi:hypothetical protein